MRIFGLLSELAKLELKDYRINVNILSSQSLDDAIDKDPIEMQNDTRPSALEVLFRRIGKGGTEISEEELNYSAIKAYWDKDTIKENEKIAKLFMPAERLIRLAFRMILTDDKEEKLKNDLSIIQIRKIAKEEKGVKSEECCKVIDWFKKVNGVSRMSKIMDDVNQCLTNGNCPKVLRTSIAQNSPDVYLLMMYLSSKTQVAEIKEFQALAYYLHWFCNKKNKNECVNIIFALCQKSKPETIVSDVKTGLSLCINKGLIQLIDKPENIKINIGEEKTWNLESNYQYESWWATWSLIKGNIEMLLYAEKEYMNEKFPKYDPALKGMWELHNRPWDIDHIIPQDWINGKHGEFRKYCQNWLNVIGNKAAISFEANRSKSNLEDWAEYDSYNEKLLFNGNIKNITNKLTYQQDCSQQFAKISLDRTICIYTRCYDMLSEVLKNVVFSDSIIERRRLLCNIKKIFNSKGFLANIRWVDNQNSQKEFIIEDETDTNWSRQWLTVGFVNNTNEYICICSDCNTYEIGLRKSPENIVIDNNHIMRAIELEGYYNCNEGWWYAKKEISGNSVESELTILLDYLKKTDIEDFLANR